MLRQLIILFAFFALSANANAEKISDPLSDYINLEIEKVELEQELFFEISKDETIAIESIALYDIEEELILTFDTKAYLPEGFDARVGMFDIDWNTIPLYEIEEEIELGFNTKDYLPRNFNPFRGMNCDEMVLVSFY